MHTCVHKCVYKCISLYLDFIMHLKKLVSDFQITSYVCFEQLGFSSGFLAFQLQLK